MWLFVHLVMLGSKVSALDLDIPLHPHVLRENFCSELISTLHIEENRLPITHLTQNKGRMDALGGCIGRFF